MHDPTVHYILLPDTTPSGTGRYACQEEQCFDFVVLEDRLKSHAEEAHGTTNFIVDNA